MYGCKTISPGNPNLIWLFALLMMFQIRALSAQQLAPVGAFDHHEDVGNPKLKGSVVYGHEEQTYTVSGAGANMWAKADQFEEAPITFRLLTSFIRFLTVNTTVPTSLLPSRTTTWSMAPNGV